MCCFHGRHLHSKNRLDRHLVLPEHRNIHLHIVLENVLKDRSTNTSNVYRFDTIQ